MSNLTRTKHLFVEFNGTNKVFFISLLYIQFALMFSCSCAKKKKSSEDDNAPFGNATSSLGPLADVSSPLEMSLNTSRISLAGSCLNDEVTLSVRLTDSEENLATTQCLDGSWQMELFRSVGQYVLTLTAFDSSRSFDLTLSIEVLLKEKHILGICGSDCTNIGPQIYFGDAEGGHLFFVGFTGTITIETGFDDYNFTSESAFDFLIAKFSSSGELLTSKFLQSTESIGRPSIVFDKNRENFFLTYTASGVIKYNPDDQTKTYSMPTAGEYGAVVSKFKANLDFVWASPFEAEASSKVNPNVRQLVDAESLYLSGWFVGTFDIDPSVAVQNQVSTFADSFIIKLSQADGSLSDFVILSGDQNDTLKFIELSSDSRVVGVGVTTSTDSDLGSGSPKFGATGGNFNPYLVQYSASDLAYIAHEALPQASEMQYSGIRQLVDGSFIIAGFHSGTNVKLDWVGDSETFTADSGSSPFILKTNSDFSEIAWRKHFGGSSYGYIGSVIFETDSGLFIGVLYEGTLSEGDLSISTSGRSGAVLQLDSGSGSTLTSYNFDAQGSSFVFTGRFDEENHRAIFGGVSNGSYNLDLSAEKSEPREPSAGKNEVFGLILNLSN